MVWKLTSATEPFDESLDRQIWALNTERVNWETKVVEKRRIKAGEVANLIDDFELRRDAAIWKPSEEDERQEQEAQKGELGTRRHQLTSAAVENVSSADIAKPERHAEVLETFGKVVSDLSDLATVSFETCDAADIRMLLNSYHEPSECKSSAKSCQDYRDGRFFSSWVLGIRVS